MAVAVANPLHCIVKPSTTNPCHRRGLLRTACNSKPPPHHQHHSKQNRRSQRGGLAVATDAAPNVEEDPRLSAARKLATGSIKILRRGEELPQMISVTVKEEKVVVVEKVRVASRKHGQERYAGAVSFSASPPPSSVPVPSFLSHKTVD